MTSHRIIDYLRPQGPAIILAWPEQAGTYYFHGLVMADNALGCLVTSLPTDMMTEAISESAIEFGLRLRAELRASD